MGGWRAEEGGWGVFIDTRAPSHLSNMRPVSLAVVASHVGEATAIMPQKCIWLPMPMQIDVRSGGAGCTASRAAAPAGAGGG